MKKILLGSTALAATLVSGAAMAEEPIKLSLGGYFRAYGIYQNNDVPNLRSTYLSQQGRVAISGSTTLDNGITVGVYTQLRAGEAGNQNNAAGTIRRAYGFFEGSFGRLEFGSADGAALAMGYASPDPAPAAGVNSPNFYPNAAIHTFGGTGTGTATNFAGALGSTPTTYQNWDGQNTKLTYFTPRVAGFQFGVSYTPSSCQTGPSATSSGRCPSLGNASTDNNPGKQSEVWQLGLNYTNTFGGVDVALSGTYVTATLEAQNTTPAGPGTGADVLKDRESYSFGANLGYAGFTLGGSYLHDNEGVENVDVDAWDIGLKYVTGPWSAGVQYIDSKHTNPFGSTAVGGFGGEDNVKAFMIGAGYALGPGINLGVGYQNWSWDTTIASGATNVNGVTITGGKADADLFLIGTVFNF
jgi:hypothetical protein